MNALLELDCSMETASPISVIDLFIRIYNSNH